MTAVAPHAIPATGPTAPQPLVPAPDGGLRLFHPVRPAWVWFIGAHGGAGETTLANLLPNSAAADHRWPACETPAAVVLVARTSASGLLAARTAAQQWASKTSPRVHLLGLVLSPDAPGRLPKPLRELAEHVAGGVPRVWHLPWVEAWRTGDLAGPKPTATLFHDLAQLTQPEGNLA